MNLGGGGHTIQSTSDSDNQGSTIFYFEGLGPHICYCDEDHIRKHYEKYFENTF